jgi:hypothetical protein
MLSARRPSCWTSVPLRGREVGLCMNVERSTFGTCTSQAASGAAFSFAQRHTLMSCLWFGLVTGACKGSIQNQPTDFVAPEQRDSRSPAQDPRAPNPTKAVIETEQAKTNDTTEPSPVAETSSPPPTCDGVVDVGLSPLRRLTRAEYDHTVSDVFGVDGASAGLAVDERIDGVFASNRSSAVVAVQVRQYLDAAESIASRVNVLGLLACDRATLGDEACARSFIEKIGRRVARRPLQADEVSRYLMVFSSVAKDEGYTAGLRMLVQSLAQSPSLLYHIELIDSGAPAVNGTVRLSAYALAARLSFFLWSSTPDDVLLDAAASGKLAGAAGVTEQVARMLNDARFTRGIESFHSQWLGLSRLDTASRDSLIFPEWSPQLVSAFLRETTRFTDYVIRDRSGDLHTLLTAAYSFPTGPGRSIRGATSPETTEPLLLDSDRTFGLLTQPAFLASYAHTNQTSPILRGRALRERFFCQPLPDPPPNVAAVAPALSPDLTTRERYAMHRTANTDCLGCHRLIDDLGFALEHYDAVGRYRDTENGKLVDSTGELIATDVDGPLDGVGALANRMNRSSQVSACYATHWIRYALGRSESDADRCAIKRIQDGFNSSTKVTDLLIAIATSDAFVRQVAQE